MYFVQFIFVSVFVLGQQFLPAPCWPRAPEVAVNLGPDRSDMEISFLMSRMFDLAKIQMYLMHLLTLPSPFVQF